VSVSRRLRFAAAALALCCAAVACDGAKAAEDFPRRPVRIFVPYGEGGAGDMTIRLLANSSART
jgi:tripartite-type tricarboxylate transporter receptor subunit TctC